MKQFSFEYEVHEHCMVVCSQQNFMHMLLLVETRR